MRPSQQDATQQEATLASVHKTRGKLWVEAFSRLSQELRDSDAVSEDLLKRLKMADERLGVLYGDRPAPPAEKLPEAEPEVKKHTADRFRRYRLIG